LEKGRLDNLNELSNFEFQKVDFINNKELKPIFENNQIDQVIHLGAQAGVRYSILNPQIYIDTNITGFLNILENSKNYKIEHIIYASSSSIYGINKKIPFSEDDKTEKQISMYGVSKKTNELMAHAYSNLYGLKTTGLRFFTVYGPWGRPDMAYYIFTKAIIKNESVDLFNRGDQARSFTYINDITEPIHKLVKINYLGRDILGSHEIFNIGGAKQIKLLRFIDIIEKYLGKKAKINLKPMQQGDVKETNANIEKLEKITGYLPQTNIEEGIEKFIDWYMDYHQ
jgi:Nucleoside-diphosphate-sugar epimerases